MEEQKWKSHVEILGRIKKRGGSMGHHSRLELLWKSLLKA